MKINVLLLLFLAAMVVSATSQPPSPIPLPYDYYSVVFQWAKSVCNTGRHQCTKPIPPAFTLRGLWPQWNHSQPLDDCRLNLGYTNFKNASIPVKDKYILMQYWPNMDGPNEDFWRREYEKHGSCVEPFYSDQLKYFVTAHRVATSTDLYSILQAAGIRCGYQTTVRDIQTAIHASTGFWPTVQCNRNITKTLQLFQIHLCFNKTTNGRMDCPIIKKGCIDPNYPIDYPSPWENKYLPSGRAGGERGPRGPRPRKSPHGHSPPKSPPPGHRPPPHGCHIPARNKVFHPTPPRNCAPL